MHASALHANTMLTLYAACHTLHACNMTLQDISDSNTALQYTPVPTRAWERLVVHTWRLMPYQMLRRYSSCKLFCASEAGVPPIEGDSLRLIAVAGSSGSSRGRFNLKGMVPFNAPMLEPQLMAESASKAGADAAPAHTRPPMPSVLFA